MANNIQEIMLQADELLVKELISQATFEKIIYGLKLQSQDKLLNNKEETNHGK